MTRQQLHANGFAIVPQGRKVGFVDTRNGYCSPAFDPDTCQQKLHDYMGAHRVVPTERNAIVLPL